jgi:hypothetical protein
LIGEHYPDATTDYEIPNAMVGYQQAPRIQPRLRQRTPVSGVTLQLALDMGKYVNSCTWRDDSPR